MPKLQFLYMYWSSLYVSFPLLYYNNKLNDQLNLSYIDNKSTGSSVMGHLLLKPIDINKTITKKQSWHFTIVFFLIL